METESRCVVTLLPDPFRPSIDRRVIPCAPGQWLCEVAPTCCLVGEWVAVDGGRVIVQEEWGRHLLVPGAEIVLYPKMKDFGLSIIVGMIVIGMVAQTAFALTRKQPTANVPSTSSDLNASATYGFSGIQNSTRVGAPIPVVYGQHRVGGQILNTYVETRNDSDVVHLLLALSEGEISLIQGVEINGQPIANYTEIVKRERLGTNTQTAIGLFGDKTATTFQAEGQLTTTFNTYTTQGENLNGFVVKLTFPGGLFRVHGSGSLVLASVSIEVDYKLSSSGTWITGPRQTISDNKRAVMRRQIRVDGLAAGQYDIRVRRTTTESSSTTLVDAVVREAITELINDGYTYPNVALLSVEAVATNQLSGGIPRVTAEVLGVKVKRFFADLTYTVEWSQNPAWVVFDMLTNERYGHGRFTWRVLGAGTGLNVANGSATFTGTATVWTAATLRRGDVLHDPVGQAVGIVKTINYGTQSGTFEQVWGGPTASNRAYEVRSNDLDILSFDAWGQFCQYAVPNGAGGMEDRAQVDMVFDAEREDVWSAVLRICGIGQAALVKTGNYIRVKIEQAADPVQLFTMANIKADSFEEVFLPLKDRSNIFEVQFLNEQNAFQQDMVVLEDPLIYTNSEQPRRKTINGYGITRSSHALRLARFNQRVNRLVTRTITFEVGLDAVACEPGDVIRFQHDIPQWGYGGRAGSGSTSSTIVLDRPVTIEAAKSYEVLVRHDNDSIETAAVTNSPGTVTTLAISGTWWQTPAKGEVWAFGETLISTKPFRVITIERTQELDARITAVEYSAAVYDETGLTPANAVQYSSLGDLIGPPGQVKNLTLLEIDGIQQSVWVSFTPPGSANFKTANIYRIDDGAKDLLGQSATGSFPVSGLRGGEAFTVKVTSVSSLGGESDYTAAPVAGLIVSQVNPPDVPLLVLEGDRLRWNYPNPPRDLAGFLVRFRPGTSKGWDSATAAHDNILLTTDLQIFRRVGVQTYLVKAVDKFGNESVNAKVLTVSFDAAETDNIVFTYDHAAMGWPGTITGGSIVGNEIQASALAQFWSSDDALFWSGNDAALMWSAVYGSMTYEFTIMPDADTLDAMLKLQLTMQGDWSVEYQPDSTALMWDADSSQPMWSSDSAPMWEALGGYTQWPGQLDHLRQQPYQIRITGHAGTVQAVLEQLTVLLDVQDLIEVLENVPLAAGGSRLLLQRSYRKIVSVRWSLQESGGSAAYIKVMDKALAGPLLQGFTTGGAGTAAVVDVVVHGY